MTIAAIVSVGVEKRTTLGRKLGAVQFFLVLASLHVPLVSTAVIEDNVLGLLYIGHCVTHAAQ
jgi:hypothetical protein